MDLVIDKAITTPDIQLLHDGIFFRGMRDEFTSERFHLIKEKAEKLESPDIYGHYKSEKAHLDTVALLLLATTETRHRGLFLSRYVLPRITHYDQLLDIGPGGGLVTRWVASSFKNLTIVEENYNAFCRFTEKQILLRKKTSLIPLFGSILDRKVEVQKYNLVLLSHVLYYVDSSRWLEVVKRAYDAVASGGAVVIVLNGDQYGKAHLIEHFGGKKIMTDALISQCCQLFPTASVEVFKSMEKVHTKDMNSMLHIAGLFLSDAHTRTKEIALRKYINEYFNDGEGSYKIDFSQKFILLWKS